MPVSQKRLGEIAAIADEDIDTSDIPEADGAWFEGAKLALSPEPAVGRTGPARTPRGATPSPSTARARARSCAS